MSVKKVFIRTPYNYDTDAASFESGLSCPEPTLAQQQFKDDNNPNLIMETFARTGDLTPYLDPTKMQFPDLVDAVDYRTALHRVQEAEDMFYALPAKVRARFENDAGQFLEFFQNPENLSEAISLGLMKEGTTLPKDASSGPPPKAKADEASSASKKPPADE